MAAVETPAPPAPPRPERRFVVAPCPTEAVARLEAELGVSHVVAQVLVRRGLGGPGEARTWREGADAHDAGDFRGIDEAVALIRRHIEAGTKITIHGDYD